MTEDSSLQPPATAESRVVLDWQAAAIVVLALVLRMIWLGLKPAHFDEGVNGWFVDSMTREGYYHYDPSNFHGPLHFYVLFFAQTLLGRAEWVLRLPVAIVSTVCVVLLLQFRAYFDRRACWLAALAMAISPGMVFYGRYAIHESWQLLFLLLTFYGGLGLWKSGTRNALRCVVLGITGMILTKETYAIHVIAMLLAWPALVALESFSPSAPAPLAKPQWKRRDLGYLVLLSLGLIVFFYSGAFLDWPDFSRERGSVGSLAGLWECFHIWGKTGMDGLTGHEKPWAYWLELLVRYEWPGAAGLVLAPLVIAPRRDRLMRYVVIAGLGTLTGYSIIAYKTPWCLIVLLWPFLLVFGQSMVWAWDHLDRWCTGAIAAILLAGSLQISLALNYRNFADEAEPYVYVQTLPDVNKLLTPLRTLARVNPANFHLSGHVLLPESDSHPLPWLLADFPQVTFLDESKPPDPMDADFLLVEDAIVSDVEERLRDRYFKDELILRGGWGNSATLYLRVGTFAPLMPGRVADFEPSAASAEPQQPASEEP